MNNENLIKKVKIIVTCLIVFLFLWVMFIYPLGTFNTNEKKMANAAKRYFELNPSKLPKEGEVATVGLNKLYNKNYLDALYVPYTKTLCSVDDAWVKVKRKQGDYKYYTYLKCGILSSNVDHTGPNIVLNGAEKIKIDLNSSYKELGVKSVTDNTDGKIDVSKVKINSSALNTAKVGTYKVKYSVSDSFNNLSVVTRTVVVRKTLASIINKDTNNSKVYKGEVANNYVRFANTLFRIMRLNDDGTITIVSDDALAYVNYAGVEDWLNNYYYSLLPSSSKKFLTSSNWCQDEVSDVKSYTGCSKKTNKKVSTVTIDDYKKALNDGETYLSTYNYVWLTNGVDQKKAYSAETVYAPNDIRKENKTANLGLRVVLTLKKGAAATSGNGSVDNPYSLGDVKRGKSNDKLNTRYSGEYITYGGRLYRIVNIEEDGAIKVICDSGIGDDGENVEIYYDSKPYSYNSKKKGNIGFKVNKEIFKYIKTDYFVNHEVKVPIYKENALYGKETVTKKDKAKLSLPNMYEIYSAPDKNVRISSYWFINSSKSNEYQYNTNSIRNVENRKKNGSVIAGIRVVGYLSPKCTILSGARTIDDPYKIVK